MRMHANEDNANHPVLRLIATDGSFKIQPREAFDIITPERDLRNIGKGAGMIVFLPPGYNEQSMTPQAVCIHHKEHEPGMNAYTRELAGHTADRPALHQVPPLPLCQPTVRDKAICMADAVAGRTKAKLGKRIFQCAQIG